MQHAFKHKNMHNSRIQIELVITFTAILIRLQLISSVAGAIIRTNSISAAMITTSIIDTTLIDICK